MLSEIAHIGIYLLAATHLLMVSFWTTNVLSCLASFIALPLVTTRPLAAPVSLQRSIKTNKL